MYKAQPNLKNLLIQESRQAEIKRWQLLCMAPVLIMLALALLLVIPITTPLAEWLLDENRPIELLTFAIALWAAIKGFQLTWRCTNRKRSIRVWGYSSNRIRPSTLFYLVFSLFFFFFAMEEISWGQQFLGFATPKFWEVRNAQNELTLHNYDFAGASYLEAYPLLAGLIGLTGLWAKFTRRLPDSVTPPMLLLPWFGMITLHSGIDLSHEFYIFSPSFDTLINHLDEAAEMLVAVSGLIYIYFHTKRERTLSNYH